MPPLSNHASNGVFRILDANINRLREALRVIEEHCRFVDNHEQFSVRLKKMRHDIIAIEQGFGAPELLRSRDVSSDVFASANRPEEMVRQSLGDIAAAGLKRAQEASRVIEEYAKVTDTPALSDTAKQVRFALYSLEQEFMGALSRGKK